MTAIRAFGTKAYKPRSSYAWHQYQRKGENVMKSLISILAVTLALAFTGPAFAQDVKTAKTAADCAKAGGMWDAATNTCSEKKM
jgi:hypothetical protein